MKTCTTYILLFLISCSLYSQNINTLNKYISDSEYLKAVITGENLIKKHPENPEIYYKTGIACQMLNRYKKAQINIYKAYLQDTTNIKYINAYAKILDLNAYPEKALIFYQKTLKIDSLNYSALIGTANLFFSSSEYIKAIKILKSLTVQDSLNPYYYRRIGYCYLKLQTDIKGLTYYHKAYLIDSTNILNIKTLASVYLKMKLFDKAISFCNKGIKLDSMYSDFYKIKANALFAKNHFYRAIPQYKKVLQLGDSSYNISKRLGMALCETKKYNDALRYNSAIYKADSASYSNSLYLCRTYLGLKDYDKSLQYAERTLKLLRFAERITFNVYDNMAFAYTEKGEYRKALKIYQKKLTVFETKSEKFKLYDYYQTALLYDKLNDKQNALKYYQKVAEIRKHLRYSDPENPMNKYTNQRIIKLKEDLFFKGK